MRAIDGVDAADTDANDVNAPLLLDDDDAVTTSEEHAREEEIQEVTDASSLRLSRAALHVAALGSPLILQYISTSTSQTFQLGLLSRVGGERAVAAFGLGTVVCSVTAHSVIWGLGSGVDTTSSQANGMGAKRAIGETALRATVILWTLAATPGGLIFWNAEKLLSTVGVDAEVAEAVQAFARVRIPGLFAQSVTCVALKTMMAMKLSERVGTLSASTTPLKFIAPWFFVWRLRMGLHGAAVALTCIDFGTMTMYLTAFLTSPCCRETLRGCRLSKVFEDWGAFLRLAVPGLFMSAIEWWSWDFNSVLASMCANATLELATQAFLANTYFFFYSWACVWARGASTSVGNALGERKIRDAATLARATAVLSLSFALVSAMLFFIGADALFATYTQDDSITRRLDQLVPLLTLLIATDGLQVSLSGVIVGAGQQTVMTPVLVFSYWCVGIPLAAFLGIGRPKLGLVGIWIGILVSSVLHLVFNVIICFAGEIGAPFAIQWRKASENAIERLRDEGAVEDKDESSDKEDSKLETDSDGILLL